MNLPDRTVQTHRFNLDAEQLFALQFGKQPIQYTGFRPAIHARVDGVPVTVCQLPKRFGEARHLQPF